MIAANIGDNRLIHLIATDTHGPGIYNTAQRQHRDFRCATADINNHGARWLRHRQIGPDGSGHWLFDQEHAACTGAFCRFLNGATLDRCGPGRDTDNDLRAGKAASVMHLANKVLNHFFGNFEVGDHAIAQRANGLDVSRRPAQHHLRLVPNSQDLFLAFHISDGDHRRLVQNNTAPLHIDECIGRAEVDCHIGGQKTE